MNYVFIVQNRLGSAVMRGIAVARALRVAGVSARCVTPDQLRKARISRDTVGILVKAPHPWAINHLRRHKATVVFDPVDTLEWHHVGRDYDIVLANNQVHADRISTLFKGDVVVVPHLHTNVQRVRKDVKEIQTVGYVGLPQQFSITAAMKAYCAKKKLRWRQGRSEVTRTVNKMTMKLDLGVIYLDESIERYGFSLHHAVTYKPATKLINVLSFGIPCLFTPTVAFMEVVDLEPALRFLVVDSVDQLHEKIDALVADKDLYGELAKRAVAASEHFHMDRAKEFYVDQLCDAVEAAKSARAASSVPPGIKNEVDVPNLGATVYDRPMTIIEQAVEAGRAVEGWMDDIELVFLARAAAERKVIVEVGSWKGRSTKVLAVATPGVVYAVDTWKDKASWAAFRRNLAPELKSKKVIPLKLTSLKAAKSFVATAGANPDMVFIDAGRSYTAVKKDILAWQPLLVKGGLLSGHDYKAAKPGVVKAVDELVPQRYVRLSIWYTPPTK